MIEVLERELGIALPGVRSVQVHVRSDRNAPEEHAIEIDASDFSGGSAYPDPAAWSEGLLKPLDLVAKWAAARGESRLTISGNYRLSTAFALGWSFRSAIGFELNVPAGSSVWATDDRPPLDTAELPWELSVASRPVAPGRLVAAIGILRDLKLDVAKAEGISADAEMFTALLPQAITTAAEAQASAAFIKAAISTNASQLGVGLIDLYLAGPAAFAVVLGHRWNALPGTQLHEYISADRSYVPTVRLA